MPFQLKSPLRKEFRLERSDKEFATEGDPTSVIIRQATQGDYELIRDLLNDYRREYDGQTITISQRLSPDDIRRREVYLTLSACNIMDEHGKPLFKFEKERLKNELEFKAAWYRLPPVVAEEIHKYVLEINPLWDDGTLPPVSVEENESEPEVLGEEKLGKD